MFPNRFCRRYKSMLQNTQFWKIRSLEFFLVNSGFSCRLQVLVSSIFHACYSANLTVIYCTVSFYHQSSYPHSFRVSHNLLKGQSHEICVSFFPILRQTRNNRPAHYFEAFICPFSKLATLCLLFKYYSPYVFNFDLFISLRQLY